MVIAGFGSCCRSYKVQTHSKITVYCTINGHGVIDRTGMKTAIPNNLVVNFYVKEGEILTVSRSWTMWKILQQNHKQKYSDYPEPTYTVHTFVGPAVMQKLWITLPERKRWVAGVFYNGVGHVHKRADLIEMTQDREIRRKSRDNTLDLGYILTRIDEKVRRDHSSQTVEKIVVDVLTDISVGLLFVPFVRN